MADTPTFNPELKTLISTRLQSEQGFTATDADKVAGDVMAAGNALLAATPALAGNQEEFSNKLAQTLMTHTDYKASADIIRKKAKEKAGPLASLLDTDEKLNRLILSGLGEDAPGLGSIINSQFTAYLAEHPNKLILSTSSAAGPDKPPVITGAPDPQPNPNPPVGTQPNPNPNPQPDPNLAANPQPNPNPQLNLNAQPNPAAGGGQAMGGMGMGGMGNGNGGEALGGMLLLMMLIAVVGGAGRGQVAANLNGLGANTPQGGLLPQLPFGNNQLGLAHTPTNGGNTPGLNM